MRKGLALLVAILMQMGCAQAEPQSEEPRCMRAGCSGQLCVKAGRPLASTCEWTQAYACYEHFGECAVQANGACGWTESQELLHCLEDADSYVTPEGAVKSQDGIATFHDKDSKDVE